MALTRVTSGVLESNAVSAAKLANSSIVSRHYADTSIELEHLATSANWVGQIDTVTANVNTLQDNINIVSSNVNSQRVNVNVVSSNVDSVAANTIQNKANVDTALANVIQIVANADIIQDNVTAIHSGSQLFTVNKTFEQNVTIQGNLIVVGSQVDLGVGTATVDDNFIVVSANLTGTPATDSGIVINRGAEGNVFIGDHIVEDGVVFALTQSPHDNATIAIQEYLDVHANAFHAASDMNFSRVHSAHKDDESTGLIFDTTNTHIKFIVGGTEQANINSTGNLFLSTGILHGPSAANTLDLDDDELGDRQNSITLRSLQSVGVFLDSNDSETGNFFNIYDGEDDPNNVSKDDGIFSVRDDGNVFVSHDINIVGNANVGGVNLLSNDFATYTRLNANLNVLQNNVDTVSDNVTVILGGGILKEPFMNVNTATGTSNVFFIGADTGSDNNVFTVTLDGLVQPNTEFIMNHSNDTIQFKDADIPSGTVVTILSIV